jgi:3-dehydroquinate dehydratase/shikimate dehydrogenase
MPDYWYRSPLRSFEVHSVSGKSCLSFLPESNSELNTILEKSYSSDLIELRLDHLSEVSFPKIRNSFRQPVIITIRLPEEGGFWKYSSEQRIPLLQSALDEGMDYIDLEWKYAGILLKKLVLKKNSKIIISDHTPKKEFDDLKELFQQMKKIPGDVYKLVFNATEINDNLVALRLHKAFKEDTSEFIIHAMGEPGKLSRILGALKGNAWTYVSMDSMRETASGQPSLDEFNNFYLPEKSDNTRIIGLIGYPLAQSPGWKLHNRLIHLCKENLGTKISPENDFIYLNFPVSDFNYFWDGWKHRIAGLSITIPHKEKLSALQKIDALEVTKSGVCNTILKREKDWYALNLDFLAMADLLRPYQNRLKEGVLVIGTGATTRTSIAVLKDFGIDQIFITGRNEKRGLELSRIFSVSFLKMDQLSREKISGMIQTTPVGMYPEINQYPEAVKFLKPGQVVLDVIHNPAKTAFLKAAENMGCTIISGRDMFLNQAWRQFQVFSGIEIEFEMVQKVAQGLW